MTLGAVQELQGNHGHAGVTFLHAKSFTRAMQGAFFANSQARKKFEKVKIVLGSLLDKDPFYNLQVTNHGESRIANCVKYDLGDGWRLVTQQTEKICSFLFVGDHDDTDRWLDANRGLRTLVRNGQLAVVTDVVYESFVGDRNDAEAIDWQPFLDQLDDETADYVVADVTPRSVRKELEGVSRGTSTKDLHILLAKVEDTDKAEFLRNVLTHFLAGDFAGAKNVIDLARGLITPAEDLDPDAFVQVSDGDELRRLRVGSAEYESWLKAFEQRSTWYDWFLFLHPEQERVVMTDYEGTAQLSGVSGSGKTCVIVRRAIRLAERPDAKVLLLTLNRSLAGLLRHLVDAACVDTTTRERITVTSFFDLAKNLVVRFEPENAKHYDDVTWRLNEHVDEIFREFYRCWTNNDDASSLLPLHRSLNGRGVSGETYLRAEMDWIRSALFPVERAEYGGIERSGRKFPILPEHRRSVLHALEGWERKMSAVGVIDYLGLTSALARHFGSLRPEFTNILVDEAQDFGTTELRIVRRLVPEGPDDIFLCGDVAQTILPKRQSLEGAGLMRLRRDSIRQNYRNSREILTAAYKLLTQNLHEEMFEGDGFEILDPKFANFSGPAPMALAAETLEEEIAYARSYAAGLLASGVKNVCIAFAGFSSKSIGEYAKACGVSALNGAYDPSSDMLVFSDLEETKGYEFDALLILNCSADVLPARDALPEEAFRESCKLYVAMTRAKKELFLSFNGSASPWIAAVSDTIAIARWSEVETLDGNLLNGEPPVLPELEPGSQVGDEFSLAGRQFVYTRMSLGLTPEAQDKICELVDGRGLISGTARRRLKWKTVGTFVDDLILDRKNDARVGTSVAANIRETLAPYRPGN